MSHLTLFPAIDLKDGKCVQLQKGAMEQATVFCENPGEQAASFCASGAEWLHVVDLNGAFAGRPVNGDAVGAILHHASVPVQLGGGIRSLDTIESWLEKGVARVILGTMALRFPAFVIDACKAFPGQVAVGVDARDGFVAVEGWAEVSDMLALDLARKFEDAGVAALIYTDIDRNGALCGPNVEETIELAEAVTIPVIASGGIRSLDDLEALRQASDAASRPLGGVIVGRALYEGRIALPEAIAALK